MVIRRNCHIQGRWYQNYWHNNYETKIFWTLSSTWNNYYYLTKTSCWCYRNCIWLDSAAMSLRNNHRFNLTKKKVNNKKEKPLKKPIWCYNTKSYIYTYIVTYMHTYIHSYIHIYIHIHYTCDEKEMIRQLSRGLDSILCSMKQQTWFSIKFNNHLTL